MKKFTFIVLIMFFSFQLQAQTIANQKGNKALQFGFDGFSTDRIFGEFGGKYWSSEAIAYFGSISSRTKISTDDDDDEDFGFSSEETERSSRLNVGVERHIEINSDINISPYYGGSLFMGNSTFSGEADFSNFDDEKLDIESRFHGITVFIGVEYFFTKSISLAANQLFVYQKTSSTGKAKFGDSEFEFESESSLTRTLISPLILSIYF